MSRGVCSSCGGRLPVGHGPCGGLFTGLSSLQSSSSVALLHKHLQLLLPHATEIYSRSATLLKESPWNGSVGEKLRGRWACACVQACTVYLIVLSRECSYTIIVYQAFFSQFISFLLNVWLNAQLRVRSG